MTSSIAQRVRSLSSLFYEESPGNNVVSKRPREMIFSEGRMSSGASPQGMPRVLPPSRCGVVLLSGIWPLSLSWRQKAPNPREYAGLAILARTRKQPLELFPGFFILPLQPLGSL